MVKINIEIIDWIMAVFSDFARPTILLNSLPCTVVELFREGVTKLFIKVLVYAIEIKADICHMPICALFLIRPSESLFYQIFLDFPIFEHSVDF